MPNHYSNILFTHRTQEWEDEDGNCPHEDWLSATIAGGDLLSSAVPEPPEIKKSRDSIGGGMNPPWYEWSRKNWGTKWGDYDGRRLTASGEGGGPIISFSTAWSAPHGPARAAIRDLLSKHGLRGTRWVGLDPYDDKTHIVEDWTDQ